MPGWLTEALDYIPRWLEHQMRLSEQPGCAIAVAHRGRIVLERAFGHANLATGETLTPRHRFRVASHSKTFTAAGILKLREADRLRLDDPVGRYVEGLHPQVAAATIGQLLSHSAGLIRDGSDSGQWQDRRPFLDEAELRAALAEPPVLPASSRFKYSNHGFGLLGLVIERVTGKPYREWIAREIVARAGLQETVSDMPVPADAPMVGGHSGKLPLGRRLVVPGTNDTKALSSATLPSPSRTRWAASPWLANPPASRIVPASRPATAISPASSSGFSRPGLQTSTWSRTGTRSVEPHSPHQRPVQSRVLALGAPRFAKPRMMWTQPSDHW